MDAIADLMDEFSLGEVRVTHEQNLVLPHVRKKDLPAIHARLKELDFATPNAGLITDIICLPGPGLLRPGQCALHSDRAEASRSGSPIWTASTISANSRSRFPAASMPAAITMPAISASWAWTRRAWNSTSCSWAVRARKTPASATIMGPGFGEHEIADAVERVVNVYLKERTAGRTLPGHLSPHRHGEVQGRRLSGGSRVTRLIKDGAYRRRISMRAVADDAPLPDGAVLVSLARFQKERDALLARNTPIGVRLQASENPELLGADVNHFSLVALEFPKFRDGRAFSWARMLRTQAGLYRRDPRGGRFPL